MQQKNRGLLVRIVNFVVGIWIVSLGIVLCVKCGLGISPISSVPYVLSLASSLTLGTWTMLFHFANTAAQYVMEKKKWNPAVLLQIPMAFLFGWTIDFLKQALKFPVSNVVMQILCLAGSIFFTALGMLLIFRADFVQNPPDGTVKDISRKIGMETGKVKIIYDCSMCVLSIVLSLVLFRQVKGIGIATIASAILVGRTLTLLKHVSRGILP